MVHDLLDAYENHDAELLQAVQRKPTITYLDNEVSVEEVK